jgi:hypothetical protein
MSQYVASKVFERIKREGWVSGYLDLLGSLANRLSCVSYSVEHVGL